MWRRRGASDWLSHELASREAEHGEHTDEVWRSSDKNLQWENSLWEVEEEEGEMSEEMSAKLTALDKRLSDLMIALESLEKRLDKADIAKAVAVQTEQATALRSSKSVDAAAFYAQVVERVARGL